MDYTTSPLLRFKDTAPTQTDMRNRSPPSETVHFFNMPLDVTNEAIEQACRCFDDIVCLNGADVS
jgi:hypothetical protein